MMIGILNLEHFPWIWIRPAILMDSGIRKENPKEFIGKNGLVSTVFFRSVGTKIKQVTSFCKAVYVIANRSIDCLID